MESPRSQPGGQPEGQFGGRLGKIPAAAGPCAGGKDPCRLNLLLSCALWTPDPWVERLPLLLEPMGIRSHRAATGSQATEVLRRVTPIHIAVVDLGLPLDDSTPAPAEEGGPRLLEILHRLEQPPPTVVVKRSRTHRDDSRDIAAALRAGAFAVIDRPRGTSDLEILLDVLRRCLLRHYQGRWPGLS